MQYGYRWLILLPAPASIGSTIVGVTAALVGLSRAISGTLLLIGLGFSYLCFVCVPLGVYLDQRVVAPQTNWRPRVWFYYLLGVLFGPIVGTLYLYYRRKAIGEPKIAAAEWAT